jgi:hypothetical protein
MSLETGIPINISFNIKILAFVKIIVILDFAHRLVF